MWAYRAWHGHPLPSGLGRDEQLAAYAAWCNAVEGNTTFYGLPSATTVAAWAEQAPAGFRFVFKLPRTITHERRLRERRRRGPGSSSSCSPRSAARAEQLSVQLPASFGPPDLGALATFVRRLPALARDAHRLAVEVRHPAFFDGSVARRDLARILADAGAEWITLDSTTLFASPPTSEAEREAWERKPRLPVHREAVGGPADRAVHRSRRPGGDGRRMAAVDPGRRGWLREGRTPTVFVHTPDNVDAVLLARLFHDQVRAVVPELDPLPVPRRRRNPRRRCSERSARRRAERAGADHAGRGERGDLVRAVAELAEHVGGVARRVPAPGRAGGCRRRRCASAWRRCGSRPRGARSSGTSRSPRPAGRAASSSIDDAGPQINPASSKMRPHSASVRVANTSSRRSVSAGMLSKRSLTVPKRSSSSHSGRSTVLQNGAHQRVSGMLRMIQRSSGAAEPVGRAG